MVKYDVWWSKKYIYFGTESVFDVINLYISLYNFGQTLRWFNSLRFLEWLIIWNEGSTKRKFCSHDKVQMMYLKSLY